VGTVSASSSPDSGDVEGTAIQLAAELAVETAPRAGAQADIVSVESREVDGRHGSIVELDLPAGVPGHTKNEPNMSLVVLVVDVGDTSTPGVFSAVFPTERHDLRNDVGETLDSLQIAP
jgi:hypothetical protein